MTQQPRLRILLADDYPGLTKAWRRLLQPRHDVVGEVADGRSAVAAAIELDPDVVVVDISMPQMNGLAACRAIRNAGVRARLVVITADGNAHLAQAAFHAGASAFVIKHAAGSDLLRAIEALLEGETFCSAAALAHPL
jgi:DNA-binding NarL/FixJ family response regulator